MKKENNYIDECLEEFDEWSVCKPWELDSDYSYIDCDAKELKDFIKQKLQQAIDNKVEEIREEIVKIKMEETMPCEDNGKEMWNYGQYKMKMRILDKLKTK